MNDLVFAGNQTLYLILILVAWPIIVATLVGCRPIRQRAWERRCASFSIVCIWIPVTHHPGVAWLIPIWR